MEDDECWALPGIERIAFSAPSLLQIQEKIFAVVTMEGAIKDLPRTRSLRTAIHKKPRQKITTS
jgi:hypothetical protein